MAVIPAEKDDRQGAADIGPVQIGGIGAIDIHEAAALIAPWSRSSKKLALRFFRQI